MTFRDDLKRFSEKVSVVNREVFVGVANAAHDSIRFGSTVTGAPPLPVDTGFLRSSYVLAFPSATTAEITTNAEYAPYVEEGINRWGKITFKNGGPFGVHLTVLNFPRLVDDVTRKVAGAGQ